MGLTGYMYSQNIKLKVESGTYFELNLHRADSSLNRRNGGIHK